MARRVSARSLTCAKRSNEFYIRGVSHNISFLAALIEHSRFREGRISTNMIAEEYPDGFHPADVGPRRSGTADRVAASIHRRYMDRAAGISGQLPGYERNVDDHWVVVMDGEQHPVEIRPVAGGHEVIYGDENYRRAQRLAVRPAAVPGHRERRRRSASRSNAATCTTACSTGVRRSTSWC